MNLLAKKSVYFAIFFCFTVFFVPTNSSNAQTNTITVDFSNPVPYGYYLSRSSDVQSGTYNRIYIKVSQSTPNPLFNAAIFQDLGDKHYTCLDNSCAGGSQIQGLFSNQSGTLVASTSEAKIYQYTFSEYTYNSTLDDFLFLFFDPNNNNSYTYFINTGSSVQTLRDGFNENSINAEIAHVLCNEACIFSVEDFDSSINITPIDNILFQNTYETRFTNSIAYGSSSTAIYHDIDYFLNTAEYTANNRPDTITINTVANGFFSDQQVNGQQTLILPLTDGINTETVLLSHDFANGDYISFINFFNINSNNFTFRESTMTLEFTVSGGAVTASEVTNITTGLAINDGESVQYQDCSISDPFACIVNALIYVFVPASDSFQQFTGLWQQVENKPPFGYVTSVINTLESATTTTAAFDFGNIPFQNEFFTPFKNLLAIAVWGVYGFFFMGRLSKLDI